MHAFLKNKSLRDGWNFRLDSVPVFLGKKPVRITEANILLAGFIDPLYNRTDLLLVSNKLIWIKRFTGWRGQPDIFVQITENEARDWFIDNGYLDKSDQFEFKSLLSKAVKLEFPESPMIKTISIKEQHSEEPSRLMDGDGGPKHTPWPSNFYEW